MWYGWLNGGLWWRGRERSIDWGAEGYGTQGPCGMGAGAMRCEVWGGGEWRVGSVEAYRLLDMNLHSGKVSEVGGREGGLSMKWLVK